MCEKSFGHKQETTLVTSQNMFTHTHTHKRAFARAHAPTRVRAGERVILPCKDARQWEAGDQRDLASH